MSELDLILSFFFFFSVGMHACAIEHWIPRYIPCLGQLLEAGGWLWTLNGREGIGRSEPGLNGGKRREWNEYTIVRFKLHLVMQNGSLNPSTHAVYVRRNSM